MMLYVNGSNYTAAAEAVNPYSFASDDVALPYLGQLPHPENLAVSWGKLLSLTLNAAFQCDAVSDATNIQIVESTRNWLKKYSGRDKLVIIQCAPWNNKLQEQYDMFVFHQELDEQGVPHIFFNGLNSLEGVSVQEPWGTSFINPYDPNSSFDGVCRTAGIETISPNSPNFGADGHSVWHRFILNHIITNKII